jgi:hypothetical protein
VKNELKNFITHYGPSNCIYIVKHYFEIRNDNVFPIGELPQGIQLLALQGNLNYDGMFEIIDTFFPKIDANTIDIKQGIVQISPKTGVVFTVFEADFLEKMLSEIMPLGCIAKIILKPYVQE